VEAEGLPWSGSFLLSLLCDSFSLRFSPVSFMADSIKLLCDPLYAFLAGISFLSFTVPGEAGRDDIDCVYVLLELKNFRDGDQFTCNLGGG